ncbi:alpha-mannosidase [Actinomadura sp. 21ATH]|uniref:glycoside hydrolase family 38 N-terminal domain-containing protein n=1 Tax=Actinomadura sp. 21ATH TaxID=1735444 RepID=UPI0035C24462
MRVTGTNEFAETGGAADPIVVVPHTHWDREWYLPFQRFRLRLVSLLDEVLERMERDPRWCFTLDGQMAAVDDYLEVRPEHRERLAALVREGRLAVGPWQILHDEFLCSGENIVRNLEMGLRRAAELGAAMEVGYLPDQFGHCAQMPQILRQAGIEHACLWRGVPSAVSSHAFAWEAPDGSVIRTTYLPEGGYGNAAGMFEAAAPHDDGRYPALYRNAAEFIVRMRPWRPEGGALLAMYGADHTAPAADLADQIAAAGMAMRLDTLAGYFAREDASADGLTRVRGELRSHARANILPGVISARVHLKQAMSRAERLVERHAEPLAALWHAGASRRFLDMAWRRLIEVSCHDSVTGCGSDETAAQVAARMAEAEQLGRAVCDLVTAERAAAVPLDGHLIFNPSPAPRTGLVTLDVPVDAGAVDVRGHPVLRTAAGRRIPTQTLETAPTVLDDAVHPASELPIVLERVYGRVLFGQEIRDWSVSEEDRTLTFHVTRRADTRFSIADVKERLRGAEGDWRVRILADPRCTVAALVETPPLGYTTVGPADSLSDDVAVPFDMPVHAETETVALDNGLLRVEVRPDGTLTLRTPHGEVFEGLGRLVDGGDLGDTYNYAPPRRDRLVDTPAFVQVEPVWPGPLVGAFDVVRTYHWPAAGDAAQGTRSKAEEEVIVTTRAELRAGEPFLRLWVTFDNRCDDHRVRLHFPLPEAARSSFAEGQFAIVERGLTAEGGFGEKPVPTFPATGFVAAGGLAVLLEHVSEYELASQGSELAVTLLRSVGYLSRDRNAHRDQPAGPQLATPQAQCRGERTAGLAVMPYRSAEPGHDVLAAAEAYRHDLLSAPGYGPRTAPLPPARTGIEAGGPGVVMTSLRERDGWLEVRLVAEQSAPTTAFVRGGFTEAVRTDLRGRPGPALSVGPGGTVTLPLRPWEIATVRIRR